MLFTLKYYRKGSFFEALALINVPQMYNMKDLRALARVCVTSQGQVGGPGGGDGWL